MFHLESFHDPWQAEGSETVNHVIQNEEYSNFITLFVEKNKSSTKQSNRSKKGPTTNVHSSQKEVRDEKSGYVCFHSFAESSYPLIWAVLSNFGTNFKVIGGIV